MGKGADKNRYHAQKNQQVLAVEEMRDCFFHVSDAAFAGVNTVAETSGVYREITGFGRLSRNIPPFCTVKTRRMRITRSKKSAQVKSVWSSYSRSTHLNLRKFI